MLLSKPHCSGKKWKAQSASKYSGYAVSSHSYLTQSANDFHNHWLESGQGNPVLDFNWRSAAFFGSAIAVRSALRRDWTKAISAQCSTFEGERHQRKSSEPAASLNVEGGCRVKSHKTLGNKSASCAYYMPHTKVRFRKCCCTGAKKYLKCLSLFKSAYGSP